MTLRTPLKAALIGVGIIIAGHVMYIGVLMKIPYHEALRLFLLCLPVLAAFATAYLAPHKKIAMGLYITCCGAVISLLSGYAYEFLGFKIDVIGSALMTFAIILAYNVTLGLVGSVAGYLLGHRSVYKGT